VINKQKMCSIALVSATIILMLTSIVCAAQSSDALVKKGIALEILNRHEEAIKACDQALEINPFDWSAWYAKGIALEKLGKSNEAKKTYDKAVELNPKLKNYGK